MTKPLNLSIACVLVATLPVAAQTSTAATRKPSDAETQTTKSKPKAKATTHRRAMARPESATVDQVRSLRSEMQAQIDGLKAQLAERDTRIAEAETAVAAAKSQAIIAAARSEQMDTINAQNTDKIQTLQSTVADLQIANNGLTQTVINNKTDLQDQIESPAALHYKGITITPVVFFAFEGVYRNRSVNSDINTPFNSIPLPSANEGHVSELNFTGRQSRLGGLFEGNAGKYKLSGFFEADFLSAGVTSNNNQSESYTFRQRQIWGKVETKAGFGVTGGQMWSLVSENGLSTNNRTEKLPNTVDSQYMVGFSWARQPAIRVQQQFGDLKTGALTLAASLEEAQITNFTAASATTGAVPSNFFFSGTGVNGGLYNAFNGTYANNVAPDVIAKAAYDLSKAHFEVGGLARFLRVFYYPIVSLTAPTTANPGGTYTYSANYMANTRTGGGVFGSARVSPSKYADLAVQVMAGQGTGRYGSSQLADATIRPDGTLEPIRNYHGLFSLETHPTKRLDAYAYYGGEYAQRTYYSTANGSLIGYGAPNLSNAGCYALPVNPASATGGTDTAVTCAAPTRYMQEGMVGATYRVVNSPKYGRLQYQLTYSYLQRNLWSGSVNAVVPNQPAFRPTGPRALDNMIHVGMRYYIP